MSCWLGWVFGLIPKVSGLLLVRLQTGALTALFMIVCVRTLQECSGCLCYLARPHETKKSYEYVGFTVFTGIILVYGSMHEHCLVTMD